MEPEEKITLPFLILGSLISMLLVILFLGVTGIV
jgi:hypothetical protein